MDNNLIFGIRPVVEAIEAGREIEKLYIRKGAEGQLMTELRDLCLRHRVRVQEVPVEKLNRLVRGNHQGVVAQIAAIAYVQLDDILERVPDDETPLVVVFDGVTDVRNFGAIARSAECAGAHGLIAPLKNSAPVNAEAIRASAGALTTIPVCRVGSIRNTIKTLQAEVFQVVAATEKSRKLLQLTIDVGEKEPRNIFSGIAAYYKPEDLIGKLTAVVANLEPRKMMGSFSQGMLLSASDGADTPSGLYLLEPFPGAKPGMRLH